MIEETVKLLDKALRFIHSAILLKASEDYESSVSRLYYAMFYCAEALLLSKGMTFSSHKAVIAQFGLHFIKTGELPADMHANLRSAFDIRQQGDYWIDAAIGVNDVDILLENTLEFVEKTCEYLSTVEAAE